MKEAISTTGAPGAIGPYSQAIKDRGTTIFVSGQIPLDPATGAFPSDDIREQTEQSLKNVGAILSAAGCGYGNVVKTTVMLSDIGDFAAMNEVYAKFFAGGCPPARSAFAVKDLPRGAKVEIEAVAIV